MTISVHKILIQRGYLCSLGKVYLEEVTAEQRSSAGRQGRESTFQGEGRRSLKQEGPDVLRHRWNVEMRPRSSAETRIRSSGFVSLSVGARGLLWAPPFPSPSSLH